MWVRTQNMLSLVYCNRFCITKEGSILGYQGPEDYEGIPLGHYEKKAALIVLMALQEHIKILNKSDISFVFTMPLKGFLNY